MGIFQHQTAGRLFQRRIQGPTESNPISAFWTSYLQTQTVQTAAVGSIGIYRTSRKLSQLQSRAKSGTTAAMSRYHLDPGSARWAQPTLDRKKRVEKGEKVVLFERFPEDFPWIPGKTWMANIELKERECTLRPSVVISGAPYQASMAP